MLSGFVISLLVLVWALRNGQFKDQKRARFLPLEEGMEAEPVKISKVGVIYNKAAINRAFENMGFLNTIYQNLELVTLYDTTRTEEQEAFNRIRKEKGLKAALQWRDSRFKEEE